MTFVALGFVLIGTFLIIYSLFLFLQKDVTNQENKSKGLSVDEHLAQNNDQPSLNSFNYASFHNNNPMHSPGRSNQRAAYSHGAGFQPNFPNNFPNINPASRPEAAGSYLNIQEVNSAEEINFQNNSQSQVNPFTESINPQNLNQGKDSVHQNKIDNDIEERSFNLHSSTAGPTGAYSSEDAILFKGMALYYEDHTGLIKYDGSNMDVDETLKSYKNFYRIGEGDLILTKTGISFQGMEHFFQILFDDINNIVFYQNCLVLLTRREKVARIFFPDKYSLFRTNFRELIEKENSNLNTKENIHQRV